MSQISVKQGEAKHLTIQVLTTNATPVDLSGTNILLGVKRHKYDSTYAFSHTHSAFDVSLATQGVISVFLTTANTIQYQGTLTGELKIVYSTSPIQVEKTSDFTITIYEAVVKY